MTKTSLGSTKCAVLLPSVAIDESLLKKASETVQQALYNEGYCEYQSRWVLVVTWYEIELIQHSTVHTHSFDYIFEYFEGTVMHVLFRFILYVY